MISSTTALHAVRYILAAVMVILSFEAFWRSFVDELQKRYVDAITHSVLAVGALTIAYALRFVAW